MKKQTTFFILFLLMMNISHANMRYFIEIKGNYTYTSGQDSTVKMVVHLTPFSGAEYTDTFWAKAGFNYVHRVSLPPGNYGYRVSISVLKANNALLGKYTAGNNWDNVICNGYENDYFFGGNHCIDYAAMNAGQLCAGIQFNFINDIHENKIGVINGHFSDPWGIYCDPDIPDQEGILQLTSPCHFNYLKGGKNIRWYESVSANGPWHFLDTGIRIFPAKISWKKGSKMFNQKRYYKAVADTAWITADANAESTVFGPVRFYLNSRPNSIVARNKCSDTANGIFIMLKNDTLSQTDEGVAVFLWTLPDTGSSERYYFGRFYRQTSINLQGLTAQTDPYFPANPTIGKTFDAKPGKYRIFVDFAPWRGFNCKVITDTVVVEKGKTYLPYTAFSRRETCPGAANGAFVVSHRNHDPHDTVWQSFDSLNWSTAQDTFQNLQKGRYPVWLKNTYGCVKKHWSEVAGAEAFGYTLGIDTTLCNGQKINISAAHPNATQFQLQKDSVISKNTSVTLTDSGTYIFQWTNADGCIATDTAIIKRYNLNVAHDFLVPSKAFITDTVYAVDQSIPQPESMLWQWDKPVSRYTKADSHSLKTLFKDTGMFRLTQFVRYKQCGFQLSKNVQIGNTADTGSSSSGYGYKGPLIQSFSADPNPNDGTNFNINVKLREKANIIIYKLDAVTGDIIGDIDYYNKSVYQIKAFQGSAAGVFYLKLLAGDETKTIKVVVIQ